MFNHYDFIKFIPQKGKITVHTRKVEKQVQVDIAAELGPVRVAAARRGEDDADGLVDIAQALDGLTGRAESRLPVGGGDAGVGDGRGHAPMVEVRLMPGF